MIRICTVYFEGKYTPDYVERLYNSLKRNCTLPFEFICYSDNPNVKADKVISVHAGIPSELFTGDKRYDQKHLSSLSEKEKQEIGLYPVTMGGEPDSKFHTVSSVQYSFSNKKVVTSCCSSPMVSTSV